MFSVKDNVRSANGEEDTMADNKDVGEVSVTLSHDEVKAGVKEMVGKKQVQGVNSTFRVDKTTANVSGDGVTTTPIAVVVTVADPMADPKKGLDPNAKAAPAQPVAASKGVINNTPVEAAPQPAKLGAPTASAAPAVSGPGAKPQLTAGRQSGRGLSVRQSGPVVQAKAGPLAPPPPRANNVALKKDQGPRADGPETQAGPKLDQTPGKQAGLIGVKEEVIIIPGGLNGKDSRKRQIATLGQIDPHANGAQLRDQQGPKQDEHGPQHGRRPSHRDAMPRHALDDGASPKDAPQVALDKPLPKAAPVARIASPTAKMAQLPSNAPTPYAKA